MPGDPRPPWYERFGGISRGQTATQRVSKDGVPVPEGGTFQGRPPRGRVNWEQEGPAFNYEERWSQVSRADRTAEVTEVSWLTRTGTLRLAFEVIDDKPFSYVPGNFVRLESHVEDKGYRRGTYCIASPPSEYRRFELLVRLVGGPMSQHVTSLQLGDEISFRGPTGRSMQRLATGAEDLVLIATGVGIAPLYCLAHVLLRSGFQRRIDFYWGLRSVDDICLTAELDRLSGGHHNFRYRISLSDPPPGGWDGLRGRVTESVPPLLPDLEGKRFVLTGNGAMIEEFASALAELGVDREFVYEEPYFNGRHIADPAVVAEILDRFPDSALR